MTTADPGSFRDPTSQVFQDGDRVVRALRGAGCRGWDALTRTQLLEQLTTAGEVVSTRQVELPPSLRAEGWEILLEHERVPFVSYPYEWPFSMLRDAARLQLQLLLGALEAGITLKDATPYNVQWKGSSPLFIDVGSFQPLEEGEPWLGYRQFCRQFLFPLMLRAYRDVPYQPWLRGSLEGIAATDLRRLLRRRDLWRRAVVLHVVLQARAEAREGAASQSARDEVKRAGFRKELIQANVRGLLRVIERLRWEPGVTAWSGYAAQHDHVRVDRDAKSAFVAGVLDGEHHRLVWDLGANDGHFSRLAARSADVVVAMDSDEATVDALYRTLRSEGQRTIVPLVVDLADPSPSLGWAGAERPDLPSRGKPDLVLSLAVLHHLAIGRNVPIGRFVGWLRELGAEVVVEFAELDDPMVKRLTMNKRADEVHPSYDLGHLRKLLSEGFDVVSEQRLPSGHRTLLHVRPRS